MFKRGEKIKSQKNGKTYIVTIDHKDGSDWVDVRSATEGYKFTGALQVSQHKFEAAA